MGRPFLSIAIPTFRRPEKLAILLDLLSKQKNLKTDDWEIFVSDNCSGDSTKQVVESYFSRLPVLKYYCHAENIGPDRNQRSVYDRAAGDYVWVIPDDDQVSDEFTVNTVINKIKNCDTPPAFIILNLKWIHVETHELIHSRSNPIFGDIFLSYGRDILNVLDDMDLIGLQRFIVKRSVFPDPYIDNCMQYSDFILPMIVALVACTKGPVLVVGEPLAVYGACDPTPWRVFWPHILLQAMPEMLLKAASELQYSEELVHNIILKHKRKYFGMVIGHNDSDVLVFQKYKISWRRLSKLYGSSFVFLKVISAIPWAIRKKLGHR